MAYLEGQAAFLRRGANGIQRLPATGLVASSFTHHTSRAGDPALHSHVLVANMAQDADGRFGALDGRAIYRHAQTAGYLYQAELRHQLGARLGLAFGEVRKGAAEIEGVPAQVLCAFSTRRAEIEQRMAERGESSARAAEAAALDTRASKDYGVSVERLHADWAARAAEVGFAAREVEACLYRAWEREPEPLDAERLLDELAFPLALTRKESSFSRREVIRTLAERSGSLGACAVGELADRFLTSERVVVLAPERELPEARYTTPELLQTERQLLQGGLERQAEGAGLVDDRIVQAVLAGRPELSAEQAAMVRGLTESGDGIQVVLGRAGSGKTYALEPARAAWAAEGYRVIGAALSARAAQELQRGSGIGSTTLARLLVDSADPPRSPLDAMTVVVVNEASMVGTRDLAELARHAAEAGAKLVLVGDHAQLREIAAGGSFRALAGRLGAVELAENRRQELSWERQALLDIRQGRAAEAVAAYHDHGRIQVAQDPIAARAALVADWLAAHRAGEQALMIVPRLDDARELSRQAHELLMQAGEVGGPARQLPDGPVSAGDRVMALRNDGALGVQNGMRATVFGLGREGGLRVVSDHGAIIDLPASYLADGHLTYGYAITAHKAQGMTVDRAFVQASAGIDRQWGYTALSRARLGSRLYLAEVPPAFGRERDDVGPQLSETGRDGDGGRRQRDAAGRQRIATGRRHIRAEEDPLARLARDLARDASQEAALERVIGRERPGPERGLGRGL